MVPTSSRKPGSPRSPGRPRREYLPAEPDQWGASKPDMGNDGVRRQTMRDLKTGDRIRAKVGTFHSGGLTKRGDTGTVVYQIGEIVCRINDRWARE
jgi:hypothetical protein